MTSHESADDFKRYQDLLLEHYSIDLSARDLPNAEDVSPSILRTFLEAKKLSCEAIALAYESHHSPDPCGLGHVGNLVLALVNEAPAFLNYNWGTSMAQHVHLEDGKVKYSVAGRFPYKDMSKNDVTIIIRNCKVKMNKVDKYARPVMPEHPMRLFKILDISSMCAAGLSAHTSDDSCIVCGVDKALGSDVICRKCPLCQCNMHGSCRPQDW